MNRGTTQKGDRVIEEDGDLRRTREREEIAARVAIFTASETAFVRLNVRHHRFGQYLRPRAIVWCETSINRSRRRSHQTSVEKSPETSFRAFLTPVSSIYQ
jgi:hypothetical protein